jgi:choline dehydrogenase-like flavoprotein
MTNRADRVRGVDGLRVVDASLFPAAPCANTNFLTLMTADKTADAVIDGRRVTGATSKPCALSGTKFGAKMRR